MKPQMIQTLYQISLLYANDPDAIFQQIVNAVSRTYGNTMAMINLVDGACLRARTIVHPHRLFRTGGSIAMERTLCQFALMSGRPVLVQNAAEHPEFRRHLVVRLKLRRYLGVPISSSEGKWVGTLCFMDDCTDDYIGDEDIQFLSLLAMRVSAELERGRMIEGRIAAEHQHAAHLEDQLKRQTMELNSVHERLIETAQIQAVGTLARGIAHDIRNILASLRLEMAVPEHAPWHAVVGPQLDRLYAITHSLLALVDEPQPASGPVNLSEIIDFVFDLVAVQAEVDGVRLRKRVGRTILPVIGNPRRLEHLFINLILNGLDATAVTGGVINVSIRCEAKMVRVDVRDTGPGIPEADQPYLFEPFFTTRGNRTGLGLYSARRIVLAHQGRISIASHPNRGGSVTVWLPSIEHPSVQNNDIYVAPYKKED